MPDRKNWDQASRNVDAIEEAARQRLAASSSLASESGKTSSEREIDWQPTSRTEKNLANRINEADETIAGLMGSGEADLISLRKDNLSQAFKAELADQAEIEKLELEQSELLSEIASRMAKGQSVAGQHDSLAQIKDRLKELENAHAARLEESPEAFYGLHLHELKTLRRQLNNGRIAETEYVINQSRKLAEHMTAGDPVFIYGELGTGKTELAILTAEKMGKKPEIVSGSKHMAASELYGHNVLTFSADMSAQAQLYREQVTSLFDKWLADNKAELEALSADERMQRTQRQYDLILESEKAILQGGTISKFVLGPIYNAMKEGRPVILDEVNGIPADLLISLNHLLTRRPGDKLKIQQDSGEEIIVAEGFCVIMTGNLNNADVDRYMGVSTLNPALMSRVQKMEQDYLPQATVGSLSSLSNRDENLPPVNCETFKMLVVTIMDNNGNIEAPASTMNDLWNLAKCARLLQDNFSGKRADNIVSATGETASYRLKEATLSFRELRTVVKRWQQEGFSKKLDYYLYDLFVGGLMNKADKILIYQTLKSNNFFAEADGWPSEREFVSSKTFTVPQVTAGQREYMGPRAVVEVIYGQAPERTVWPEAVSATEEDNTIENITASEKWLKDFDNIVNELAVNIENECKEEAVV